jgi:hypothetical protein
MTAPAKGKTRLAINLTDKSLADKFIFIDLTISKNFIATVTDCYFSTSRRILKGYKFNAKILSPRVMLRHALFTRIRVAFQVA